MDSSEPTKAFQVAGHSNTQGERPRRLSTENAPLSVSEAIKFYAPTAHEPGAVTERSTSPLAPRASSDRAGDWQLALNGSDDALLTDIANKEPPGVALFEMETFINGLYRKCDLLMRVAFDVSERLPSQNAESRELGVGESTPDEVKSPLERARARATRVVTHNERVRRRLGSEIRDFDRSPALSPGLGAGVSMARSCGAPSWAALVESFCGLRLIRAWRSVDRKKKRFRNTTRPSNSPQKVQRNQKGQMTRVLHLLFISNQLPTILSYHNNCFRFSAIFSTGTRLVRRSF